MINELYPIIPEPKVVFQAFAEISAVPRESHHEDEIAAFMVSWAEKHGLEVWRDQTNNVIIKKNGTAGRENLPPLIIQGHLDMVCVKRPEVEHDFRIDPIKWRLEDDYLYAQGTTLGADNGIAVAYAMAILASDDISHPPLEVVLTTAEETGMDGVSNLDVSDLQGKALLNIDSEEEGIFLAACAGGCNLILRHHLHEVSNVSVFSNTKAQARLRAYELVVDGLLSGHSGMEIVKQRANAIQLMARVLHALRSKFEFSLFALQGGTKHNAIAAAANSGIVTWAEPAAVEAVIAKLSQEFAREYLATDANISLRWQEIDLPEQIWPLELSDKVVDFLFQMPHGVQEISPEITGMVRTSLNLGVLKTDDGQFELLISIRSSLASQKELVRNRIVTLAKIMGFEAIINSDYPAWEYADRSQLRDLALRSYRQLTGSEAKISAIHAGLECGLLGEKIEGADMLSMGPNIYDVHTFNEHLSISSVARTWEFLKTLLANYEE